MSRRTAEISELENKLNDRAGELDALKIKNAGVKKQYELDKKLLSEKIQNLSESEKLREAKEKEC